MFKFANLFVFSALLLSLVGQALGHAAVAPMLGVGTPKRSDVKRPSAANPCGAGVNIAGLFDSSTPAVASASGAFTVKVTSFNGGTDGSRQVTAKVGANGKATTLTAATVTKNGLNNPAGSGSQDVTVQLPAGTKCTGGTTKNKCLVQFVTSAKFGNCVVVQQGAAAQVNKVAGTRAARALLGELEQRGEEIVDVVKRKASQWIWA